MAAEGTVDAQRAFTVLEDTLGACLLASLPCMLIFWIFRVRELVPLPLPLPLLLPRVLLTLPSVLLVVDIVCEEKEAPPTVVFPPLFPTTPAISMSVFVSLSAPPLSVCRTPKEVSDWYLDARLSSGGRCNGSMCSLRRSRFSPNRQAEDRCGAMAAIYANRENEVHRLDAMQGEGLGAMLKSWSYKCTAL